MPLYHNTTPVTFVGPADVQIEDKEDDNEADATSADKKEDKGEINVKDILFTSNKKMVEAIEEMEEKVYCASMQVKVSLRV